MPNRSAAHTVLLQRRALVVVTAGLLIAAVLWIIAISTAYWNVGDGGDGVRVGTSQHFLLQVHVGIWKACRTFYINESESALLQDSCAYFNFFPPQKEVSLYTHYRRSMAGFSAITIFVMVLGVIFALYTFRHTRYMYKRLAGCCHLMSAGCALVVLEVSNKSQNLATSQPTSVAPDGVKWHAGFSLVLGWMVFGMEVVAAVAFIVCSRKRKKDKAPDEEFAIEEEPTIIGR